MSTIRVNAIQHTTANSGNMILHANGNVSMITTNTTLFVGNTAISNASISVGGVAVNPLATGFKNKVINGAMDVWQRGTSGFTTHDTYTADRWWFVNDSVGASSVSRVDVSSLGMGAQYALRAERTSGTNRWVIGTQLETTTVKSLLGKTVTFSCKIRKGSAFTSDITASIATSGSETKYSSIVDGSGSITFANSLMNTSTFTTFSYTFNIPASSAALGFKIELSATQAGATGAYFDVTDVQLEEGSFVTPFERRLYGQELTLCQRYYWRNNASATWTYARQPCTVVMGSTTGGSMVIINPVPMRSIPVSVDFNALALYDGANLVAISNLTLDQSSLQVACMSITTSGATALRPYIVMGNASASSYLGISAEL